jgi:hypothetical protein
VEAILDAPVPTGEREKLRGGGFMGGTTGQAGNDFALDLGGFLAAPVLANALDLEDLSAMGEAEVVGQFSGDPDAARFDAAVSEFRGFLLRGE